MAGPKIDSVGRKSPVDTVKPSADKRKSGVVEEQKQAEPNLAMFKEFIAKFGQEIIHRFSLLAAKVPSSKSKKYEWTQDRKLALSLIVSEIIANKNVFFKDKPRAAETTAKFVSNEIQKKNDLANLFSKKVEAVVAQLNTFKDEMIA